MKNTIFEFIEKEGIKIVDLRFVDVFGKWQHFSMPADQLDYEYLEKGVGFDGSSIKGFKPIEESDLILKPDTSTAFIDPFFEMKTLCMICDVFEPITLTPFEFDTRLYAKRSVEVLKKTKIADTAFFGPEAEFFIFDSLSYHQEEKQAFYRIDSEEAFWNSGNGEKNLAYTIKTKEGYFPVPPHDSLQDLRSVMTKNLQDAGITVEKHHHEVATAGQSEIDIKYDDLVVQADNIVKFKYIVKSTAKKFGKVATFMPKPIWGDNGSGMHTHISLWKDGKNLFSGDKYGGLSETALYFIGGLLRHAGAVLAFCAPTTNSYKRLVPGYEAPVNLVYSKRNRSAAIRIPMYSDSPSSKRIEFRPPDPSANPYLAFSAMLLAGLDGIIHKTGPGSALDKNIFSLGEEEKKKIRSVPGSLKEALDELENDSEFLLRDGVFSKAFIDQWIAMKTEPEYMAVTMRPHPYEFLLYHDC